jgi:hypothetical protein
MLQTYSVSAAKSRLTELRRVALTGQEILIENEKESNSDSVSIIATFLLDEFESCFIFTHKWVKEDGDTVWTLVVPEIDVFGVGETKEDTVQSLAETAQEYAELFFGNLNMYMSDAIGRRHHYFFLRRIARCNGDLDKIKKVLGF